MAAGKISTDYAGQIGHVKYILNENFGIIEIGNDLALFDTYDLYLQDKKTAAECNKSVDECVQINHKVVANACLVDPNLPLSHLATAVWIHGNSRIKNPEGPLTRDQIAPDKLGIFDQVSKSCKKVVESFRVSVDAKRDMVREVRATSKYK